MIWKSGMVEDEMRGKVDWEASMLMAELKLNEWTSSS
jgi:hypothetical protein